LCTFLVLAKRTPLPSGAPDDFGGYTHFVVGSPHRVAFSLQVPESVLLHFDINNVQQIRMEK